MKTVPFPGAPARTLRLAVGCALVLGLATLTSGNVVTAQEKEKGAPAKPMEIYQQVRALVMGVAARGRVVGMDLVEVAPSFDFANHLSCITAGRLMVDLIGSVMRHKKTGSH